ncbi:urokinase-type plasminogen activator [Sceloporus undulatus]|uniref:urokinase-type plasminogen activator n=1 Tax=Sceloporus undulatus TaxID=8520 RepID=UPI001C4D5D94|nr:urokinase-type plasminogen activator [Sceloporus undulatus]
MKLLIIISVMLSVLVPAGASSHHWLTNHKLGSKTKYEHKGCNCFNGGTCITYYLFSRMKRCLCPEGYSGDHCEIDNESPCYTGNGEDYRGTVSMNENNERCLDWNSPMLRRWPYNEARQDAMELGLGKHNYCRNPDGRSKPWCYVRKGYRTSETPCDIPTCIKKSTCGQRSLGRTFKIVGGHKAAIESQPWIATIFQSRKGGYNNFICGGSLIDPCWVLTAAHCFERGTDTSKLTVFLGKSAVNVTDVKEQRFDVDRLITHERFSERRVDYDNDIALIRIKSSTGQCAEESHVVKTICLPPQNLQLGENFECEVSGYGKENKTGIFYSRILKSTNVNLISQSKCQKYYEGHTVNGNMLCAGGQDWKTDSCKGDSGGPLICESNGRLMLYGIVSWGEGCAEKEKPGVYTRVTEYIPWIESHMNGVHFKSYYPPK